TFGRTTIRAFAANVSEMKRMAARDFEDILQCCISCFEGLLSSPHNETILSLLYVMAYWHGLAKMRMHTDTSLRVLDHTTTVLGTHLRYFTAVTCEAFATKETEVEYAARQCAQVCQNVARGGPTSSAATNRSGRRACTFNMGTIKGHMLGDYVHCIKCSGMTDSYSTQLVSLPMLSLLTVDHKITSQGKHEHR
ncbi:hypothetical protein BKA93DRAFT_737017, partial [Sparassis latifolia]